MPKWGTESFEEDPIARSTTHKNIDRVHHMMMDDRRLVVNHIANSVGIRFSKERVENIMHNELGMSKVFARWVPRLRTPDHKLTRMVMSQTNFAHFEADPASSLDRFLTQDECWVNHFEPETKRQSVQ